MTIQQLLVSSLQEDFLADFSSPSWRTTLVDSESSRLSGLYHVCVGVIPASASQHVVMLLARGSYHHCLCLRWNPSYIYSVIEC